MYRSVPVTDGVSLPTRVSTVASTPRNNFEMGNMQTTGREMDVALASSNGWFAVHAPGRGLHARRQPAGGHQRPAADPVGPAHRVRSGRRDRRARPGRADHLPGRHHHAIGAGDAPNNILNLGRIKMTSLPEAQLVHGDDGVFRLAPVNGQPAPPSQVDPSLRLLLSGVLEGSNTNPMTAMVGMIENARRFEQQMQVLQHADRNAERANGIPRRRLNRITHCTSGPGAADPGVPNHDAFAVDRQDRPGRAADLHGRHFQQPGQRRDQRFQARPRRVPGPDVPTLRQPGAQVGDAAQLPSGLQLGTGAAWPRPSASTPPAA